MMIVIFFPMIDAEITKNWRPPFAGGVLHNLIVLFHSSDYTNLDDETEGL